MAEGRFVTFFYALIDSRRKRLTYCNAGHNPPAVFLRWRDLRRLDCGGGILGVFTHWRFGEEEILLNSGDRIFMYTDGVSESRNAQGEEFGENQIIEIIRTLSGGGADKLTEEVIGAATRFSHGVFEDDLTIVAVSIE